MSRNSTYIQCSTASPCGGLRETFIATFPYLPLYMWCIELTAYSGTDCIPLLITVNLYRVGLTGTRTESSTTKVGGHWQRTRCEAGHTKQDLY